jgi:hypothetical protein
MFERAGIMGYSVAMGGNHESNKSTPNISWKSPRCNGSAFQWYQGRGGRGMKTRRVAAVLFLVSGLLNVGCEPGGGNLEIGRWSTFPLDEVYSGIVWPGPIGGILSLTVGSEHVASEELSESTREMTLNELLAERCSDYVIEVSTPLRQTGNGSTYVFADRNAPTLRLVRESSRPDDDVVFEIDVVGTGCDSVLSDDGSVIQKTAYVSVIFSGEFDGERWRPPVGGFSFTYREEIRMVLRPGEALVDR